jgi:hypothetical protein
MLLQFSFVESNQTDLCTKKRRALFGGILGWLARQTGPTNVKRIGSKDKVEIQWFLCDRFSQVEIPPEPMWINDLSRSILIICIYLDKTVYKINKKSTENWYQY